MRRLLLAGEGYRRFRRTVARGPQKPLASRDDTARQPVEDTEEERSRMGATSPIDESSLTGMGVEIVPSPIVLSVPADPNVSRIARLTASAIASLAGCTMDDLLNVKIAVSEAIIVLVEHGDDNLIELTFDAAPGRFGLTARSEIAEFDPEHASLALCRVVLEDVSRSYDISWSGGTAVITIDVGLSDDQLPNDE